jgi:hypothetical protein
MDLLVFVVNSSLLGVILFLGGLNKHVVLLFVNYGQLLGFKQGGFIYSSLRR